MKKIKFNFKELELVKGCPTDINGNNLNDDDWNQDGVVDQYDQDYYDGYMDGYDNNEGGFPDGDDGMNHSDAYLEGHWDGNNDHISDVVIPDNQQGPDINNPNFIPEPDGWKY